MKIHSHMWIVFLLVAGTCHAQSSTNDFETVTTTNWVTPGPYLRVVNGKLYNTFYSTNWGNPLQAIGLSGGPTMSYSIKVSKIWEDRISCAVFRQTYKPETYTGMMQLDDEEFFEYIVIYHYPNPKSLISGQDLGDCRCMRVDNYITNGVSLVALDCGIQYTNLVPVIKSVKIKI
jgi:hypothetical protein